MGFSLQCGESKKVCLLLDDEKYIHLFKLKTTINSTMLNHQRTAFLSEVGWEVKIGEDFTCNNQLSFRKNNLKRRNFFTSGRVLLLLRNPESVFINDLEHWNKFWFFWGLILKLIFPFLQFLQRIEVFGGFCQKISSFFKRLI